ncbi:MAG: hypothetical protein ACYDB5_10740 [bacterium]
MNKYKIKMYSGDIVEVKGKSVAIPEKDYISLFAHRRVDKLERQFNAKTGKYENIIVYSNTTWYVSELTTGEMVNFGKTKSEAINNAHTTLNKYSKEETLKILETKKKKIKTINAYSI